MEKTPKPVTVESIQDTIEEIIPSEIEGKKYSPIGSLNLWLYKNDGDRWSLCHLGIRLKVHYLNATIRLGKKCYGEYRSIKDEYAIVGYDNIDNRIVYDYSIRHTLFQENRLNQFREEILKLSNGNRLICDECELLMPLEGYSQIESIKELNFGNHPEFKNFLLTEASSSTKFFCRNSNEPITAVTRIRDSCSLFDTYVPEEGCYRCRYALTDKPYRDLLKAGEQFPMFRYDEFVCNLNFGLKYSVPIWTHLLNQLLQDERLEEKIYTASDNSLINREMQGNYQVGVMINSIHFPSLLLNDLRIEIIEEYKKKQEIEEDLRKKRLEKEKIAKEEEERLKDYNIKNSHIKDSIIKKDNSHYYLYEQKLLGTTRIISNFFPQFDAEYWAGIKAPLMGKTPQQLLEEWDSKGKESSEAGTKLHQRIDDYYHHKEVQTDDKDYNLFKLFADAYKLNPYRNEWAIYDEDSGIVGVVDMLDYSNGEYILYDWKRSEKIIEGGQPITKNKFDEYGLKPIEDVPNTDYWHYALQLSFYRYILEKNYGIKVKESRLVVLHPTLNLPIVLTTPYMINEVNKILAVIKM